MVGQRVPIVQYRYDSHGAVTEIRNIKEQIAILQDLLFDLTICCCF